MILHPNKSLIDGKVKSVKRAADGVGADVVVEVQECTPADDLEDFIGAKPGAELTLFTAEPDAIEAGKSYRLTTRVLGGPNGERMVVEAAEPKKNR
jgi:hypothetical protein